MPTEDRRIMFTNDEVYKAIYALCFQKNLRLPPPGLITAIREDTQDKAQIGFDLDNPQDKTSTKLQYSRDFLAAALMLFCRGAGIPLPKTAQKSVEIDKNIVILRVQR